MKKSESGKINLLVLIVIAIVLLIGCYFFIININKQEKNVTQEIKSAEQNTKLSENEYVLTDNNFSKFDLSFLKFENQKENKIYSPLSIKYAFKMLEEATTGEANKQISSIINTYNLTKYNSNKNMSLANAFFVRDSFKDNIKSDYSNLLKSKYNADLIIDSFSNADTINSWVKENTLELIPELIDDSDVDNLDFALINALGIDMEWKHKFLKYYEDDPNLTKYVSYYHEEFGWTSEDILNENYFNNDQKISSMNIYASLNNYDIVKDLGEEKIRNTVYEDFKKWVNNNKEQEKETFNNDFSEENIKKVFDDWFDKGQISNSYGGVERSFIDELNLNYGNVDYSTDFSIYVDDEVKVFSKDLKEYNGTTLQYIGIMPIKEDLDQYIEKLEYTDIIELIENLKELKRENFKDGYLTYIHGFIPKFNFEYELNLKEDLEKMGITDVFEEGKANLTNLTDYESAYINTAKHKANIEFTQDGIKAAAATIAGGLGAGNWYDYFFEMPTEEIDISFDKPYLFLIKDKDTNETWFVGTVYEPKDSSEEDENDIVSIDSNY